MIGMGNSFPLSVYCHKVLPAVFDDSLSYYEVVCKLREKVNELIEQYGLYDAELRKIADALNELIAYIEGADFKDYVSEIIVEYMRQNLGTVITSYIKQVFFGLTMNGYYCAYVPDSWSEISFDTGAVYGTPEYGRLILQFAADGQGVLPARSDYTALYEAVQSVVELDAGDGLRIGDDGRVHVDTGNGLSINPNTKMVEVPIGANLRYTSDGIDVPDGDEITAGVLKLSHEVSNDDTEHTAVSPQGVFAYVEMGN